MLSWSIPALRAEVRREGSGAGVDSASFSLAVSSEWRLVTRRAGGLELEAGFLDCELELARFDTGASAGGGVAETSLARFERTSSSSSSTSISSAATTTTLRFFAGLPWRCLAVLDTATMRCSRLRGGGRRVRPELRVVGSGGAVGSASAGEGRGGRGRMWW